MNETEYHTLADQWYSRAQDALEEADRKGNIEMEYEGGILSLALPSGKTLLVSKHSIMRQLWYSSPVSGGLHFSYQPQAANWQLSDGRVLEQVLAEELKTLAGVEVRF